MQTQKKSTQPTPKPDATTSEKWRRVVSEARESAERAPEAYLETTRVPVGGE